MKRGHKYADWDTSLSDTKKLLSTVIYKILIYLRRDVGFDLKLRPRLSFGHMVRHRDFRNVDESTFSENCDSSVIGESFPTGYS